MCAKISNENIVNGTSPQERHATFQRSQRMQEIISSKPDFLVRWGNLFFLIILLMLCAATWFIKYPARIHVETKLTSTNAPKPVVCRIDGTLAKLNIYEGQHVTQGEILGYMSSIANPEKVLRLASNLDTISALLDTGDPTKIKYHLTLDVNYGELQSAYRNFVLDVHSTLARGSKQTKLETEIKLSLLRTVETLKNKVNAWTTTYILTAPTAGRVAFKTYINENQQLHAGQAVCYVYLENSDYYAEIVIPKSDFKRIAVGQRVLLKLEAYPSQEYGSIVGRIEQINQVSNGANGFSAKIVFPNGPNTTYKKRVAFREGLAASAEIMSKDVRLLDRIITGIFNKKESR